MRRLSAILFAGLFTFAAADTGLAAATTSTPARSSNAAQSAELQTLRLLLKTPDARIDLATAKLAIDHMIDPTADVSATHKQLNGLVETIQARFPADATSRAKLDILLSSLYQPGPWNDHRPFSYDFTDPFGKVIRNKLLSTYLATRKGNCVSMPVLLVILGQKLGLDVTLATAPEHLLVKFLDEDGQWLNVEATAGGFKYDSSYERETGISPLAVENAIYLRPLSRRESAAIMMSTLMEFHGGQSQQANRIAVANLAVEVDPRNVVAMVHKATAYYWQLQQRYHSRYPTPADIPADKRQDFERLSHDNLLWFAKAEALGWTEPTQAQNADYLDTIQQIRTANQGGK